MYINTGILDFLDDEDEIVVEHIGRMREEEFMQYLIDYFPNY